MATASVLYNTEGFRNWYDLCFLPNIEVDEENWQDYIDATLDAGDVCDDPTDMECA